MRQPDPVDSPVVEDLGGISVVREDVFRVGGANGTKSRVILRFASTADHGIVTSGSRDSTQGLMSYCVSRHLGLDFEFHCPRGRETPVLRYLITRGARVVRHFPGYTSVVDSRAKRSAGLLGWKYLPAKIEHGVTINVVQAVVSSIVDRLRGRRVVLPVGSGMTMCGLLRAVQGHDVRVLGVVVGANPVPRLRRWVPWWESIGSLAESGMKYQDPAPDDWRGVAVDPYYSGKCVPHLEDGDVFWNSGARSCVPSFI